ncbi:hypothetical protein LCGC14_2104400 [marine sediment metagenome]|uniref:Uncharacterized protein n=1 Tax=marine sediment metagenome TaxID=412755 RepID=A0A0F9GM54_9ZZZZ|nr:hypothetical protein [Candidatus Anoxychlamydiales bacterium]HEU63848.1 hypothetical protein [Chlamydiota bacterium]
MYDLDKENKLFKKKILDSYTDFEDFKKNFQDFHKLSEEAIGVVKGLFIPTTPDKIIKAVVGWGVVISLFYYLQEILLVCLSIVGWIRGWSLFTDSIGSMTIGEIIGVICSFLALVVCILAVFTIFNSTSVRFI